MAVIATVTISTIDYSVYALTSDALVDANSYWGGRLGEGATAWAAASDDNKKRALVMASDWIDRATNWPGTVTVEGQARDWPRDNATNQCTGTAITDGTIPNALAYATFWLSGQLLVDPSIAEGGGQGSNIKRAKAGTAEVEYFTSTQGGARLPVTAHDYLRCFLDSAISLMAPSGSGDDDESYFDEDDFTRCDGFS